MSKSNIFKQGVALFIAFAMVVGLISFQQVHAMQDVFSSEQLAYGEMSVSFALGDFPQDYVLEVGAAASFTMYAAVGLGSIASPGLPSVMPPALAPELPEELPSDEEVPTEEDGTVYAYIEDVPPPLTASFPDDFARAMPYGSVLTDGSATFLWYQDGVRRADKGVTTIYAELGAARLIPVILDFENVAVDDAGTWALRVYDSNGGFVESPYSLNLEVNMPARVFAGRVYSVDSMADLRNMPNFGEFMLSLTDSFEVTGATIDIPEGTNVTINGNGYTITFSGNDVALFTVSNATLNLENITLQGIQGTTVMRTGVAVNADGVFEMRHGSTIQHFRANNEQGAVTVNSNGRFYLMGGSLLHNIAGGNSGAGGVQVVANGVFHMYDGSTIAYNRSAGGFRPTEPGVTRFTNTESGGVRLQGSALFNMYGGAIRNNVGRVGGGVQAIYSRTVVVGNSIKFNMYGGLIHDNVGLSLGGGVNLESNTVMEMHEGAVIRNNFTYAWNNNGNTVDHNRGGGGIFMQAGAELIMYGGSIHDNVSLSNGGGVDLHSSNVFTMHGGSIYNNTALNIRSDSGQGAIGLGGGVNLRNSTNTFVMRNGLIRDNEAINGGGVSIRGGTFTMYNGIIDRNTAAVNGGGVLLAASASRLYINNGVISNNSAGGYGGGVMRTPHFIANSSNVLVIAAYLNVSINPLASFHGNTAGNGHFVQPVENTAAHWHPFRHLLTNSHVSFVGPILVVPAVISFDAGGGTGTMNPVIVPFGDNFEIPDSTFVHYGYRFVDWNTEADGSGAPLAVGDTISNVENDITLFAQWELIPPVVVSFDAGGGTGIMDPVIVSFGDNFEIPDSIFVHSGYRFVDWNAEADGSGAPLAVGGTINNVENDITLFAQWEQIQLNVTTPDDDYGSSDSNDTESGVSGPDTTVPGDDSDGDAAAPPVDSGGTNPDEAPTSITENATMMAYDDMWVEFDENGVPLGAWSWDDEEEMWIFDEMNVPLGVFAAPVALMPQTGLTNNTPLFAIGMFGSLSLAAGAMFVIYKMKKKEQI